MIIGTIKTQIDAVWNAFWSGGISNPMEVIEQMTYLLFIKRLDELQTLQDKKASRLKQPSANPIFGSTQQNLRWSVFRQLGNPLTLYHTVSDQVFPFIKNLGGEGGSSTYSAHMKDARFTIPTPALLAKVVDMLVDLQHFMSRLFIERDATFVAENVDCTKRSDKQSWLYAP